MYGDTRYEWVKSGSTTASAATAHLLLGTYNGLSLLNAEETLGVQVLAITNSFDLLKDATLVPGFYCSTSAIIYQDIPPMKRGDVSNLHFRNSAAGNATARWQIWRRVN